MQISMCPREISGLEAERWLHVRNVPEIGKRIHCRSSNRKGLSYGGSLIRPEATGYGLVYFARDAINKGKSFEGRVAISGSGNVAQFACEKVLDLGGKPVTMSDSGGYIYDESGIDREKLAWIMDLKNNKEVELRNTLNISMELSTQNRSPSQIITNCGRRS